LKVITRFNINDFAEGVSDIAALRTLLKAGATVRGIKYLHSKLYLFGDKRAILTSANLTEAALRRNHEFGFVSEDAAVIAACNNYFVDLWAKGGSDLTEDMLDKWDEKVARHLITGRRQHPYPQLGDYGANAGFTPLSPYLGPPIYAEAPQAFVKFLGESKDRVPLSCTTYDEIVRSGCHKLLAYPSTKRPRNVKDGAIMFVGRLTQNPADIRVFGRAIGMSHVPERDNATQEDKDRRKWMGTWDKFVRVHHAEFVAGTMNNGISLNQLMDELKSSCFMATQRNERKGEGNTDPRRAYSQQAAVQLSTEGQMWLAEKLQSAFDMNGTIHESELGNLE